ncbi:MAG: branched-chain amino acid transaminase [Planctomycetota bacterium]
MIQASRFIFMNGKIVPWEQAQVHVMSHALHYGSSVFEGIRVYDTPAGSRFFRLHCHTKRLFRSAKIHDMPIPYSAEEIDAACAAVIRENGLRAAYVRPLAFRGFGALGLDPTDSPVELMVAAMAWGRYLGQEALEKGVDVCVSSWQRLAPNTLPLLAKAGGQYLSNALARLEAKRNGYAEAITLTSEGTLSEGSGENLFLVHEGTVYTPGWGDGILQGITRESVLTICHDLDIPVIERSLPREMLLVADEIFLTGTAAEITPVRSVDRALVGEGQRGPITQRIQEHFFGLFEGKTEDRHGWLQDPSSFA